MPHGHFGFPRGHPSAACALARERCVPSVSEHRRHQLPLNCRHRAFSCFISTRNVGSVVSRQKSQNSVHSSTVSPKGCPLFSGHVGFAPRVSLRSLARLVSEFAFFMNCIWPLMLGVAMVYLCLGSKLQKTRNERRTDFSPPPCCPTRQTLTCTTPVSILASRWQKDA